MMNVIAVANQKGGVGKTTTAIQLAATLGRQGERVLLLDLDPQGHASLGLGVHARDKPNLLHVIRHARPLSGAIQWDVAENVDLVPGNIGLSAAERVLGERPHADRALRDLLPAVRDSYEYIIVDCPPALGLLSINALRAADLVLVPVEASLFSLDGLERLKETLHMLDDGERAAPSMLVLPNMFDTRTRLASGLLAALQAQEDITLSRARIRATVRVREATYQGTPLTCAAPKADITGDFECLAADVRMHFHRRHPGDPERADGDGAGAAEVLREVTLSFQDIRAARIQVAGDFNDWVPDKDIETIDNAGRLTKVLHVAPGDYEYRVIIDGIWQRDPTNPERVPGGHGGSNSLLHVRS